ncbi:MAG: vWA domain-containing protein [Methylococcaceae bacterium]
MKTKSIALSIFAATAVTVTFFPTLQQALATTAKPNPINPVVTNSVTQIKQPKIEVVFVLDTTGSMSGLINAAKEKIWSIASTMASAQNAPNIKMGLVAYRDRGDAYITQRVALSYDLDSMYAKLMDLKAEGGGDTPESVNQALYEAVNKMDWDQDQQTYKVVFLVGDAPAHMDYQDDIKYPKTMAIAQQKGIIINAIQAGQNRATTANWQQVATLGNGNFFQVEQTGNAVAIATPYDKKMAALSAQLDGTRMYYGDKKAKKKQANKVAATAKLHNKASTESKARRAAFNTSVSGKNNFLGDGELVDAIASGRVELSSIADKNLPESIQSMPREEQSTFLKNKAKQRKNIETEMKILAEKRSVYLKKEVAASGGKKDSLDAKIFSSIREQAKVKGLLYDENSAKY